MHDLAYLEPSIIENLYMISEILKIKLYNLVKLLVKDLAVDPL